MQIISSPEQIQALAASKKRQGNVVGVVPTMGALHQGHISLVEAAARECDFVITTIFVNPTQFAPGEDFERYPRTLQDDLDKCRAAGAHLVFTPVVDDMYPDDCQTTIRVHRLTTILEGAHRPEHFEGVTTIVGKLFNITLPDKAFFGQKDYQQQLVIRRMVSDLNWPVEIVTCPIIRDPDGLAMSSRNRYLSASEREAALNLSAALMSAEAMAEQGITDVRVIQTAMEERLQTADGLDPDYAVVVDAQTLLPINDSQIPATGAVCLIAAKVGSTRLIDNILLKHPRS